MCMCVPPLHGPWTGSFISCDGNLMIGKARLREEGVAYGKWREE